MTKAFVYIRFSTPKQEDGNTIDRQRELCLGMCAKRGWTVSPDDILEDKGKSAWKGDHLKSGKLGGFADRVRAGQIEPGSVLVIEQLDRLSRESPRKALRWMEDLCDLGIRIATVEGDKVYDEAGLKGEESILNVLQILIKATVAHGHSKRKSELNYDNWARRHARARNLEIISRRSPAWLSVSDDGKKWIVNGDRKNIVLDIFRWSADGQGNRQIAGRLNAAKTDSFAGWTKAARWTDKYIGLLIHSPAVEGDYIPGASNGTGDGERIVGYYPRIVPADLVDRARVASKSRRGTGGRYRHLNTNLFARAVVCGSCGGPMALRPRQAARLAPTSVLRKGLFQCRNSMQRRGCERREMYAYAPFEKTALDAILHLTLDDRYFQRPDDTVRLVNNLAQLAKEIDDLKAKQRRAVAALLEEDDMPEVKEQLGVIRRQLADLKQAHQKAENALREARGAVDPVEHRRRVHEVRESIDDEDEEVRLAARQKVAESIKAIGCKVVCEAKGKERGFIMTLAPPSADAAIQIPGLVVHINTKGEVTAKFDHVAALFAALAAVSPEERAAFSAWALASRDTEVSPERAAFIRRTITSNKDGHAKLTEVFEADRLERERLPPS